MEQRVRSQERSAAAAFAGSAPQPERRVYRCRARTAAREDLRPAVLREVETNPGYYIEQAIDGVADEVKGTVPYSADTANKIIAAFERTGPILAQAVVPVVPGDDAERLHERIKRVEHTLLPAVLHATARGEIVLGEHAPRVSPACFDPDAAFSSLRS